MILGIAIGALSLFTLAAVKRKLWRGRHHHHARLHGCGRGGHRRHFADGHFAAGDSDGGSFGGSAGGDWSWLRQVTKRLDATPEQDAVIRGELDDLFAAVKELKTEGLEARVVIARVLRGEAFDEEAMGELFGRHDDRLRDLRLRLVGALARIHDVLDEQQRERLSEMLGSGRGFGAPYRSGPGRAGWGRGRGGGGFA